MQHYHKKHINFYYKNNINNINNVGMGVCIYGFELGIDILGRFLRIFRNLLGLAMILEDGYAEGAGLVEGDLVVVRWVIWVFL
jgi:hypothetical protein